MGFKRAKPFVCTRNRCGNFFTTSKAFLSKLSCVSKTQNIILKKSFRIGRGLEGRSLLQSAPLLRNNPPDCFTIHSPQSALRIVRIGSAWVFAGFRTWNISEAVKKNENRQRGQSKEKLGLDLNFFDLFSAKKRKDALKTFYFRCDCSKKGGETSLRPFWQDVKFDL